MARPIVDLLSAKSDGRWGPEHTTALNLIAEQVYHRMQLGLVDMHVGVRMYLDVEGGVCGVVVT